MLDKLYTFFGKDIEMCRVYDGIWGSGGHVCVWVLGFPYSGQNPKPTAPWRVHGNSV